MSNTVLVFLFGPLFFAKLILAYPFTTVQELYIFITSGLGTAFWMLVLTAFTTVMR